MWWSLASLSNFFKLKWKPILIIVGGLLIVFLVWQWRSDIQEKVWAVTGYNQVVQTLEEQKEEFKKLEKQYNRIIKINKEYKQEIKEIKQNRLEISNDIEKLKENNKQVENWSDNKLPDAVYNRLRNNTKSSD